jgi:uroporphyrinogen decarboxylase
MIVEVGFDGLNPIERKADGNDPFLFAEKYGEDLVFIGGLDVRVLETNDKDTIQRETKHLLEGMKARNARFVFTEDHSIPPTVDLSSYLWMLDAFWQNCHY